MFKYLIVTGFIFLHIVAFSQQSEPVTKSDIIETIDGHEYYLHFVKQGQTLFSIARAYGLQVNDIFKSNPDSQKGIKPGMVLKLPKRKIKTEEVKSVFETQEENFIHIVKSKETFYSITKKYNITLNDLKRLNPNLGDYPKIGQAMRIPIIEREVVSNDENYKIHKVEPQQTLYGIAHQYGVTIGEIRNVNPEMPLPLKDGYNLKIPQAETEIVETNTKSFTEKPLLIHTTKAGETLYSIARKYAVTVDSLKSTNNFTTERIAPGQEIFIPETKAASDFLVYEPSKSEKLKSIAELYQIDYKELIRLNPEINRKARRGEKVKIPVDEQELETLEKQPEIIEEVVEKFECGSRFSKERTYNVALMLPLFLEEIDSLQIKEKISMNDLEGLTGLRFTDFYAGFRMAADSIQKSGMKLNLFVYDVDQDLEKTNRVLNTSELSQMDLIVGPLFANSFKKVSEFARFRKIPIVNPLTPRTEIVAGNPMVFKVKPSIDRQVDEVVNFVSLRFPDANVVIVRNNKYKFQSEVSFTRNSLNVKRNGQVYLKTADIKNHMVHWEEDKRITESKLFDREKFNRMESDSVYLSNYVKEVLFVNDSAAGVEANLSLFRNNIVIVFGDDIVFMKEVLNKLEKLALDHEITLMGLPDWKNIRDVETSQLLNLKLHCLTESLVNFSSNRIQHWIMQYREKYNNEPTSENFAFDGFDVGWFFLNALYRFGPGFTECIDQNQVGLIQNNYKFEQTPGNGFQNVYWNIGRFEDYELRKVVSPDYSLKRVSGWSN